MIPTKLLTSFFFSLSLSRHAQLDKGLTLSPYRGFMAIKQVILIKTSFLLYLDVLHKLFFFFITTSGLKKPFDIIISC